MKRPLFELSSFLIFLERFYSLLRNLFLAAPFKYVTEGLSKMKRKPCFAIESAGCMVKSYAFPSVSSSSCLLPCPSSLIYRLHACRPGLFNLFGSLSFSHGFFASKHSSQSIHSNSRYKISFTKFKSCAQGNFLNSMNVKRGAL